MWLDAASKCVDGQRLESRDGFCLEHEGFVGRLTHPGANFMFNPVRKMSASYSAAELIWYLSGRRDIEMISAYAPQYERFANDGYAHGAYGYRLSRGMDNAPDELLDKVEGKPCNTQISALITLLSEQPNTRQAVLSLWHPHDLLHAVARDKNDLPCTIGLVFSLRDGKLNLSAFMRSNDLWLGLPYDVFCFTGLQILIALALKVQVGWYQHHAHSLHVYDRNLEKTKRAQGVGFDTELFRYPGWTGYVSKKIEELVKLEEWNRKIKGCSDHIETLGKGSFLHQLCAMAASKWDAKSAASHITNSALRKHILAHS